ncbi:rodlin [Streptomyces sp. NPDC026206]|uniref:rodlin n=1 Tax=Streptomyces sp. NPDC026206 TaxID=3157089 RepID=UPI0033DE88F5
MLKKFLATTALAVTAVGSLAGPAMAVGPDDEQESANANGAKTGYGNTRTGGKESPQMSLIQGTLNKPCIALQDIAILAIQDIPILSSNQEMQCNDNSTINDGDDPLSELLNNIISGNGSFNGH